MADLLGGYSHEELDHAFALVRDKDNWKMPIDATIPIAHGQAEINMINFAVMFYTGAYCTVTRQRNGEYRFEAPGYYMTIGA